MNAPRLQNSYARLPELFHAPVTPASVPEPELVRLNVPLAEHLGLDPRWLRSARGVEMLAGARLPEGVEPIAMAYAGHQFGGWVPQLGDGRAALLGEVTAEDGTRYDLHLKGSGRTQFSRGGDGKAVLGPVLREYVVSEAMAALGVPTTRALAAVTTGERVIRDGPEPGAVLARVARSHVRVGTFQYLRARGSEQSVRTLADYVIDRHCPEAKDAEQPYLAMLRSIVERQADLVADWMAVGFIHGVMNTDNMQVAGETIDYGPCAFMDTFHPQKVFSSIDRQGRYAWGNQPDIAVWNLSRLAETLLPLLGDDEPTAIDRAESAVGAFRDRFAQGFASRFRAKLGLSNDEVPGHAEMIDATLTVLTEGEVDFTLFFRHLTRVAAGEGEAELRALFDEPRRCDAWLARWRRQLDADPTDEQERLAAMRRTNPIFIPRNHRIEQAIAAANAGKHGLFHELVEVLAKPFEEQPEHAALERPPEPHEVVRRTFCGT